MIDYKVDIDDFVEPFHRLLFLAINNKFSSDATKLDGYIIDSYLKENHPSKYVIFSRNNGIKYIELAMEIAEPENFESNYIELRKFSLLRDLLKQGIDVSDFYDPDEISPSEAERKRKLFEESVIDDILNFYKARLSTLTQKFSMSNSRDSVKAGSEEAYKQKEEWKKAPSFGLSYFSKYLTTATYGIRQKKFSIMSAPTGTGKTRLSVANLCYSFAPQYYDKKLKTFVDNPHGKNNAALYIGTEMELIEEVEPILWAYIANVPEDHILMGQYDPGEEERVDKAIQILHDEGNIYLEYVPDYNVSTLENIIEEHVIKHGVKHVFFDYIMITTDLISEYQNMAQAKMTVREDQVLGNLSTKLKNLTAKYNISIDTWTQVSGDFKNEANRDQTIVRGAKSIVD